MEDEREDTRPEAVKSVGEAKAAAPQAEGRLDGPTAERAEEPAKRSRTEAAAARIEKPYDPEKARQKRATRGKKIKDFAYQKTPNKFKNASDIQVRFRTGFIYVTLSVLCLVASGWTTMLLMAATAGICAGEFYYMLRSDAKLPNETIGVIAAVLYPVGTFFFGYRAILAVTVLLLIAITIWYVYWMRARIQDVGISVFGAMYVGMQLSFVVLIRNSLGDPWGGVVLLVLFVSIWANDAFAYLAGSKFGKHKLAPKTSPKKSWEGFWVGIVVSMLFWCLMVFIPGMQIDIYQALVFGLVSGLASVLGDLCESRIKRGAGFKDSGTIMPGHGGLFDRCDSLLTSATASAILLFFGGCLPWPF